MLNIVKKVTLYNELLEDYTDACVKNGELIKQNKMLWDLISLIVVSQDLQEIHISDYHKYVADNSQVGYKIVQDPKDYHTTILFNRKVEL